MASAIVADGGSDVFRNGVEVAKEIFGSYPHYIIGLSSEGVDSYHVNYDIVAAAKAAVRSALDSRLIVFWLFPIPGANQR